MNEKLTADQIFIEETIKAFEEQNNTVATEEDKKRIELLMRKQTHFTVAVATAERFAAQEKINAEKEALQEMANAWLANLKYQELSGEETDESPVISPIMDISELVDHLNFEVFRHRYPQITFENGGDSIRVEIKEI